MTDDLVYKIKTIADLQAVERSKNALEGVRKTLQNQGKESAHVTQKLREMDKALDTNTAKALKVADAFNKVAAAERRAGRDASAYIAARNQALKGAGLSAPGRLGEAALAFRGAGGGLSGLSAAAGTFGPQAAAGVAAAAITYKAAAAAIREYATAEESVVRMDAALAQAGHLTDEYRTKLQTLADELQSTTAIADEEWMRVITRLTQFGATPQTIDPAVKAVKDLAGIMDGDLQSAAMMVAKAVAGEYETFSRLGIEIDKTASKTEQFDQLCRELAERGHGMLEASAQSLAGRFRDARNKMGEFMEALGPYAVRLFGVKETTDQLSLVFGFWADKLKKTIPVAGNLQNAVKKTTEAMRDGQEGTRGFADELERVKRNADDAARYVRDLQQQTQLDNDEDQAGADVKIAAIKRRERAGLLTPEQSEFAQNQVRENLERSRHSREQEVRERTIQRLEGVGSAEALQQANALRNEGSVRDRVYDLQGRRRRVESMSEPFSSAPGVIGPSVSDARFAQQLPQGREQLQTIEGNLQSANDYWGAMATSLAGVERITTAQAAQMQNAMRRVQDIQRKLEIVESQIRNANR